MKITTRLEISKSDEDNFKEKVAQYLSAFNLDSSKSMDSKLQELVTYHRQQINTAFRLGLGERSNKSKKD